MSPRLLLAAAGGALAALACFATDLLLLSRLRFAGVSDAAAQAGVVEQAQRALIVLELRLLVTQLLIGAALGLLAGACGTGRTRSRWTAALTGAASTLLVAGLATAAMMARYPQLYSDGWWRAGGWRAAAQRVVTHRLGPTPFETALAVLGALALLMVLRRTVAATRRARVRRFTVASAALAVAVLASSFVDGTRGADDAAQGRGPDVLVLAIDSLRSDRITSPTVMPFLSSLADDGTLFRFAFTPVAHTFPSWASTLTGTEPREHGVRSMFPDRLAVQGVGPTLFGTLRDEGYCTFVTSHFAGDVFTRFDAGFEEVDAPSLTVDTLATSTTLAAHTSMLPLLRWRPARWLFPEWRNVPQLDDPEWLADATLARLRARGGRQRPVAGLVFFGTAHFPYVAPYPHYLRGSGDYDGPFLYDVPPSGQRTPAREDVTQATARYDGALRAVDAAVERLYRSLEREGRLARTLIVVTGDHGEELYEQQGRAGHGDALALASQSVPVLLLGPGVPRRAASSDQVRLHDLPATVLRLVDPSRDARFGSGISLLEAAVERPVCVETAVWFWPDSPASLRGERLVYEPVSQLLEVEPGSRALVLRSDRVTATEDAKDRGIVLGNRLWHQRSSPRGIRTEELRMAGVNPAHDDVDLAQLFRQRCVDSDPELAFLLGAVVHRPARERQTSLSSKGCETCGVGR
jgi:arylsulfatase A-like enzyme